MSAGAPAENERGPSPDNLTPVSDPDILKARLQKQIDLLMTESAQTPPIGSAILNSEIYRRINKYLDDKKTIPENSDMWTELEQAIVSDSPHFKEHLQLLVGQNLKPHDYHVVLLIRCGITATQMITLLGRTKGTISYRRKHVCEIVLGQRISSHSLMI